MKKYVVGAQFYYQSDHGNFIRGEVVNVTSKYCLLKSENGQLKRKSKRLLFNTADEAKLNVLMKANNFVTENLHMNILELGVIFKEMLDKYPEKFI